MVPVLRTADHKIWYCNSPQTKGVWASAGTAGGAPAHRTHRTNFATNFAVSFLVFYRREPRRLPNHVPRRLPRRLPNHVPRHVPRHVSRHVPRHAPRHVPRGLPWYAMFNRIAGQWQDDDRTIKRRLLYVST